MQASWHIIRVWVSEAERTVSDTIGLIQQLTALGSK
jgi:hypothetical protein